MLKEIIASGATVSEAQENAKAALGAGPLDDVKFEVIYAGKKGFLGFMSKPAQVRAYIEMPDAEDKNQRRERRERRREKPQRDNQGGQRKQNADNKPAGDSKQKNDKKPEKEKAQNSHKKSEVIPECNLKLEKREVSAGEDMSFDFVTTLIANAGLSATATLYSCDDGTRRITIEGDDAATLIGHHGDTLDAIQYLANLASAKKNANGERDKSRVTIDIEGYRAKREETLRALARRMAAKALRNKRSVMLEPMSAYERRIIHSEIQAIDGVSTKSIGSDNNRKIVIYLTDKKPSEIFDDEDTVEKTGDATLTDDEVTNAPAIDTSVAAEGEEEGAAVAIEGICSDAEDEE